MDNPRLVGYDVLPRGIYVMGDWTSVLPKGRLTDTRWEQGGLPSWDSGGGNNQDAIAVDISVESIK